MNSLKKLFCFVLVLFLFNLSKIWALPQTTGLAYLKYNFLPKPASLGEAFTAYSEGLASLHFNPSGLASSSDNEIVFMHNSWLQDITLDYLAAGFNIKNHHLAVGFTFHQIPNLERREGPSSSPLGTFEAHDLALDLSYARKVREQLNLGISFKYLYEKIDIYSASGVGIDLGGIYFLGNWQIGAAVLNLGPNLKFKSEDFSLPTQFRLGAVHHLPQKIAAGNLKVSLDVVKTKGDKWKLNTGGEYGWEDKVFLRAGYKTEYEETNFSFGTGVKYKSYAIDYAFVPFQSDLGSSHRVSLSVKF